MYSNQDPFGGPPGGGPYGSSGLGGLGAPAPSAGYPLASKPPVNTSALLSPILGVVVPLALDLFQVDCERRTGVYAVSQRVSQTAQCASVYVAAPPDESFAICLNPF